MDGPGDKAAPSAGQGKRTGATLFLHDTKRLPRTPPPPTCTDTTAPDRATPETSLGHHSDAERTHPNGRRPPLPHPVHAPRPQPCRAPPLAVPAPPCSTPVPAAPPPAPTASGHAVAASYTLHTPSSAITAAAILVISPSGTLFIRALPPTMPRPATAHRASTAPRPTDSGSS